MQFRYLVHPRLSMRTARLAASGGGLENGMLEQLSLKSKPSEQSPAWQEMRCLVPRQGVARPTARAIVFTRGQLGQDEVDLGL